MSHEDLRHKLRAELDRLRAPEGYLRSGWPRYHTLFGRDSLISAWQTLDVDPTIAASTLRILAKYQGRRIDGASEQEPGKILHEYRFDAAAQVELPGWAFPYYGSVDSTPLFLILAVEYMNQTHDQALLAELWPTIEAAHSWMTSYGDADGDGFLEYSRKNPVALFHQGWKDGSDDHLGIQPPVALVEVQGYAFAAHRAYSTIALSLGESGKDRDATRAMNAIRERFNRLFWWPEERTFFLALDGKKRPRKAVTSNPGHLLLTGILDDDKSRAVVERLFRDDLWTPYGIRTLSTAAPDFRPFGYHMGTVWPHDNWLIWKGLRRSGYAEEANRVRDALLHAYSELGRMPELYAVVQGSIVDLSESPMEGTRANPVQAWSAGALLDMLGHENPD